MNGKQRFGQAGERFACEVLQLSGYRILEQNYSCQAGEVDIVAVKGDEIFFIEVKSRRNTAFGLPCESVTKQKQAHLRKAAGMYLCAHDCRGLHPSFQVIEVGFHQIEDAF